MAKNYLWAVTWYHTLYPNIRYNDNFTTRQLGREFIRMLKNHPVGTFVVSSPLHKVETVDNVKPHTKLPLVIDHVPKYVWGIVLCTKNGKSRDVFYKNVFHTELEAFNRKQKLEEKYNYNPKEKEFKLQRIYFEV